MARKKRLRRKQIYITDWLKWKPYKNFIGYDKAYVEIANEVLSLIKSYHSWFDSFEFSDGDLKTLAIIVTSYFEDFINEIGIWDAFTRRNRKLYGYYLPFYDMRDYDPEYLNPQDFSFLVWYFMNVTKDKMYGPDAPDILALGDDLYDLLEAKIDEANATGFYDEYFNIADDIYFFELKTRLKWFATHSYLLGFEFGKQIKIDVLKFLEEERDEIPVENAGQMAYALEEDYLYIKRSVLSAFSTPEWFSETADCSAKMKRQIVDLHKRIMGAFQYEGHSTNHYRFSHLQTDKIVEVNKESVTIDLKNTQKGDMHLLTLVKWNDDWWLTGTLMSWGQVDKKSLEKQKADFNSIPFYIYSEEQQKKIKEDTDFMYRQFVEYFGKRLVFFKNETALQTAVNGFMKFYSNQQVADKKAMEKARQKFEERYPEEHGELDFSDLDWESGSGNAAVFVPGIGLAFTPAISKVIALMQKEHLTPQESIDLFYSLLGKYMDPSTAGYLLEHFPTKNLRFPIPASDVDAFQHAEFFMRYLNPHEFGEPIPNMRITPE